ncbi:probable G-protein coupled receptor 34b isoform X2 [Narcine bancroftii]|uniref:probable G-protein coupled receptor 34b isoform X2 n=1 Tax=Narcine bancroftii TaxID=1343680 RepID=UPI00383214D1
MWSSPALVPGHCCHSECQPEGNTAPRRDDTGFIWTLAAATLITHGGENPARVSEVEVNSSRANKRRVGIREQPVRSSPVKEWGFEAWTSTSELSFLQHSSMEILN